MSTLSTDNEMLLLSYKIKPKNDVQDIEVLLWKDNLNAKRYGHWGDGEKKEDQKEPEVKIAPSNCVMVERNSMCVCDYITVKIIFFPVVNFTQSTHEMAVISELLHIQPKVIEVVWGK